MGLIVRQGLDLVSAKDLLWVDAALTMAWVEVGVGTEGVGDLVGDGLAADLTVCVVLFGKWDG